MSANFLTWVKRADVNATGINKHIQLVFHALMAYSITFEEFRVKLRIFASFIKPLSGGRGFELEIASIFPE
jgi:hypothetical protein